MLTTASLTILDERQTSPSYESPRGTDEVVLEQAYLKRKSNKRRMSNCHNHPALLVLWLYQLSRQLIECTTSSAWTMATARQSQKGQKVIRCPSSGGAVKPQRPISAMFIRQRLLDHCIIRKQLACYHQSLKWNSWTQQYVREGMGATDCPTTNGSATKLNLRIRCTNCNRAFLSPFEW